MGISTLIPVGLHILNVQLVFPLVHASQFYGCIIICANKIVILVADTIQNAMTLDILNIG